MVRDLDINQTPKTEDREWIMIAAAPHANEEDSNSCGRRRKKLRLTKEQSHLLEESFIQNHTLTSKQKLELATFLKRSQRQVEVWFQNRRARYVLQSTAFMSITGPVHNRPNAREKESTVKRERIDILAPYRRTSLPANHLNLDRETLHPDPCLQSVLDQLQLKAFLILAQTISACSTSARKQGDLRQLATRSARWTARDNISSRSDQIQLAVHIFGGPFNPT
ncbi:hypothetical protein F2Q69_00014315 [Brassica cretica]|uniref:Homeobox domain-containing protein n=1 Tax=Brassica cretica TaxID=69181 RepID=A0A8S9R948_BRACR|nr:hypothetical protein F2Q69_00014315 [Brassica cretica]